MRLNRLALSDFRCHAKLDVELGRGLNYFYGDNGSGKTSLLEAAFYLSRAHSFLGGTPADVIRRGAPSTLVVGSVELTDQTIRVAVQRSRQSLSLRLGSESNPTLRALAQTVPIQMVDPRMHQLVDDSAGHRRKFMDWGLFHVEHRFAQDWKRYQLVLRQRNAALRQRHDRQARSFDAAFIALGERMTADRNALIARLSLAWQRRVSALLGEDWSVKAELRPGWAGNLPLAQALAGQQHQEIAAGYTTIGPHRADIRLLAQGRAIKHQVSRGQQKMLLLALHVAMADCVYQSTMDRSVLLFDDLPSELGAALRVRAVQLIIDSEHQWLVTGLDPLLGLSDNTRMFHVEHGGATAQ